MAYLVNDEALGKTDISILNKIDLPCSIGHIQRCHRLPTTNNTDKPTIVKFTNQLHADMAPENKKKLNRVDLCNITTGNKIFINYNLTPIMKNLAFNCRLLKRNNLINGCWPEERAIKLKMINGSYKKVIHDIDLKNLFPEFQFKFTQEF